MSKGQGQRHFRIADQLMRELGRLLVEEVQDPRLEMVTVSGVRMSPDMHRATVFVTFMGDESRHKDVEAALTKANGFLRSRIGRTCNFKRTPELLFKFDEYLEEMVYERSDG
jgi:ribosome-binding factor A